MVQSCYHRDARRSLTQPLDFVAFYLREEIKAYCEAKEHVVEVFSKLFVHFLSSFLNYFVSLQSSTANCSKLHSLRQVPWVQGGGMIFVEPIIASAIYSEYRET